MDRDRKKARKREKRGGGGGKSPCTGVWGDHLRLVHREYRPNDAPESQFTSAKWQIQRTI